MTENKTPGYWRKASYSMANGNCVEAATGPAGVLVRDTADRGGPVLAFTARGWADFTARTAETITEGKRS